VSDEPEPEVSDQPEIVQPREAGANLGQTTTTPTPVATAPAVEEAAADAQGEAQGEAEAPTEGRRRRAAAEIEEQDTADRLAQANPNSGLPWALPINFTQQLGVGTYADRYDLTNNPTYSWAFSAIPRYNFDNGLSLGIRVPLSIEWTQSDITTGNRYLWWGDIQLDATYTLPWKPGGTLVILSGLLSAGTSPISRGAQRYFGPGGRLLLIKPVPVLGGLILGGGASYTYWAGRHDAAVRTRGGVRGGADELPCQLAVSPGSAGGSATSGSSQDCGVVPGTNTPIRHVVSVGFFSTLIPAAGWQINLSFTGIWNKGDNLDESCVQTLSGLVCLGDSSENDHWRQLTSFGFSVGYDVTSYTTLTLGYSTLAFHPDSPGGPENMFFNELTTVNLGLQFRLDGMVVALNKMAEESEEAEAEEAARGGLSRTAF